MKIDGNRREALQSAKAGGERKGGRSEHMSLLALVPGEAPRRASLVSEIAEREGEEAKGALASLGFREAGGAGSLGIWDMSLF